MMMSKKHALSLSLSALLGACASAKDAAPAPAEATATATTTPAKDAYPEGTADCARDAGAAVDAALAGPSRSEKNKARDGYRHPKETLAFLGVKPGMNVVELWPGGGWYSEVLAPIVHGCGHLTVVASSNNDDFKKRMAADFPDVTVADVDVKGGAALVPDGSADMVLTFRNIHNWIAGGFEDKVYAAAFKALKPGGVFGVVEHRAKPGTDLESTKKSGYVDEAALIERIKAAGFELEDKSEVNANAKDTKDYDKGVWTLPPVLRNGDVDKDKYTAIGESDRMTLRFKKPAAK